MATALQGFRFTARSCKCRPAPHGFATKSIGRRRPFSLTSGRSKEQDNTDPDVRAALEKVESAEDAEYKELDAKLSNFAEKVKKWENSAKAYIHRSVRPGTVPPPPKKLQLPKTFMNMGERDGIDGYPDYTQEDEADIPTLAHGELEHHREMRHYARLAAWEMPLLSTLAKPFVPPTADMPLRFRYTTYMGEQHPAEKKVALEFCTEDIRDLTPMQREKLKKLVGVRYNPETDIVKMSCEMFETQAQNKRYLGDLVEELVKEAKDPTDTFEDIPLDTRHHKFKQKPKFPREWVMTKEREAALAEYRERVAAEEQQRTLRGQLVDGVQRIEEALTSPRLAKETLPGMDQSIRAGRAKGRTVAVRR